MQSLKGQEKIRYETAETTNATRHILNHFFFFKNFNKESPLFFTAAVFQIPNWSGNQFNVLCIFILQKMAVL